MPKQIILDHVPSFHLRAFTLLSMIAFIFHNVFITFFVSWVNIFVVHYANDKPNGRSTRVRVDTCARLLIYFHSVYTWNSFCVTPFFIVIVWTTDVWPTRAHATKYVLIENSERGYVHRCERCFMIAIGLERDIASIEGLRNKD